MKLKCFMAIDFLCCCYYPLFGVRAEEWFLKNRQAASLSQQGHSVLVHFRKRKRENAGSGKYSYFSHSAEKYFKLPEVALAQMARLLLKVNSVQR